MFGHFLLRFGCIWFVFHIVFWFACDFCFSLCLVGFFVCADCAGVTLRELVFTEPLKLSLGKKRAL